LYFSDQITLKTVVDEPKGGFSTEKVTSEKTVWADKRSVKRTEFYAAGANNRRADIAFGVNTDEYSEDQTVVEFKGVTYEVLRSYIPPDDPDHTELICSKRR
jgi:SPP1 family predicted phage head-tail adaptor